MKKLLSYHTFITEDLDPRIDPILDKISRTGLDSLSPAERRILKGEEPQLKDEVGKGYLFDSRLKPGLSFEYNDSIYVEQQIIHDGVIFWMGHQYLGSIACSKEGVMIDCEFYDIDDEHDLFDEINEHQVEMFLCKEVLPNLPDVLVND